MSRNLNTKLDEAAEIMLLSGLDYERATHWFRRRFMLAVMRESRGNQCLAARKLNVHRNTIRRILAECKLDAKDIKEYCRRKDNANANTI